MDIFAILSPFGEFVVDDGEVPDLGTGDPDPTRFSIHGSGPDPAYCSIEA